MRYFSEAIVSGKCQLRELNIANVGMENNGAMQLAKALESKKCKLRKIECLELNMVDRNFRTKLMNICSNKDISIDKHLRIYINRNHFTVTRITMR